MPTAAAPNPQCQPTRSPERAAHERREERAQVDAHVEDGEGAVATRIVRRVELTHHDGDAGLEVPGADHDQRQAEDEHRHAGVACGRALRGPRRPAPCARARSGARPRASSGACPARGRRSSRRRWGTGRRARCTSRRGGSRRRATSRGRGSGSRLRRAWGRSPARGRGPAAPASRSRRSAPTSRRRRAGTDRRDGRGSSSGAARLPRRRRRLKPPPRSGGEGFGWRHESEAPSWSGVHLGGEGAQVGGASLGDIRVERQKASQATVCVLDRVFRQGACGIVIGMKDDWKRIIAFDE